MYSRRKLLNIDHDKLIAKLREITEQVESMSTSRVIEEFLSKKPKEYDIIPVEGPKKYLLVTEETRAFERGYISPSMFVKYRMCARALAIEMLKIRKTRGILLDANSLRRILRGILFHEYWYEIAEGDIEVRVEDQANKIYGYIDEVRDIEGKTVIIEVKSGAKPEPIGSSLQVMAYILAYSTINNLNPQSSDIVGVVVYPYGQYTVYYDAKTFSEYAKRLRAIIDIALNQRLEDLPPRLSGKVSGRCRYCVYAGDCKTLPDRYRNYEEYFKHMGFTRLYKPKQPNPLSSYF